MSKKIHLTEEQVEEFVSKVPRGQIFGVTFEKSDGSIRVMSARLGVHKGVKGTDPTDRASWLAEHGLLNVFDMNKFDTLFNANLIEQGERPTRGAFRMIPKGRVIALKHGERNLKVTVEA